MNNFSFTRFCKYAKAEMCSNRKFLLLLAGSAVAYFLIIHYLGYLTAKYDPIIQFTIPAMLSWVAVDIFSIVFISKAFKKYYNKGYATSAIMMPVAQCEKFLYIIVFYFIIAPVTLIVMAYIINLLWSVGCSIDNTFLSTSATEGIKSICSFFAQLSVFLLGAIFFRRNPFLLTVLTSICVTLLLGYIVYIISYTGILTQIQQYSLHDLQEFFEWASPLFLSLATVVLVSITWRLFRKVQITK